MLCNLDHDARRPPRAPTLRPMPTRTGSRRPWTACAVWLGLALTGCASYPEQVAGAIDDLSQGRFEDAATILEDSPGFLGRAEAGTVRLIAGDWKAAQADLLAAADIVEEIEDRGPLGRKQLTEDVGTLLVNERVATYEGEGFERVQVHAMAALAFLAQGRLDSVGVEIKRANRILENEEELYDTEYRAGGLGHFLSALAYELRGDLGDALIDYRRMDEKGLASSLVGPELLRLATRLDREDLLPELTERFGDAPTVDRDHARVVLIAGVGLAPVKVEEALRLPTSDGIVAFAVPTFVARAQPVSALDLSLVEVGAEARTAVIEDLGRIAERNLEDRMAALSLRSAARAGGRVALAKNLRDSDEDLAAFAVDVFSLLAEQADLRSWMTLPDSWQAAQIWVPPGVHTIEIDAIGGQSAHMGAVELAPGETVVVLARTVDRSLFAHLLGGGTVEP